METTSSFVSLSLSHERRRKQGAKDLLFIFLLLSLVCRWWYGMWYTKIEEKPWMNGSHSFKWKDKNNMRLCVREKEHIKRLSPVFPSTHEWNKCCYFSFYLNTLSCLMSWCLSQISDPWLPLTILGLTESRESLSSRTKRTVHTKEESMCYTEANSVLSPLFLSKVCLHLKPLQNLKPL